MDLWQTSKLAVLVFTVATMCIISTFATKLKTLTTNRIDSSINFEPDLKGLKLLQVPDNDQTFKFLSTDKLPGQNNVSLHSDDVCDKYDVDGCSVPFGLPMFFKQIFTTSCFRHDICYHCGLDYDVDRRACDDVFRDNMQNACVDSVMQQLHTNSTSYLQTYKVEVMHVLRLLQHKYHFILQSELRSTFKSKAIPLHSNFVKFKVESKEGMQIVNIWSKLFIEVLSSIISKTNDFQSLDHQLQMISKSISELNTANGTTVKHRNSKNNSKLITVIINDRCSSELDEMSKVCKEVLDNLTLKGVDWLSTPFGLADIVLLWCYFNSNVYYYAVRIFGDSSYLRTTSWYCAESWVVECLPG